MPIVADHEWVEPNAWVKWPYCRICGVIQRSDGQNKPCKGPTKLRPMEPEIANG